LLNAYGWNKNEGINIVEKGGNYGWNTFEGTHCHKKPHGCDTDGLIMPIFEYDHDVGRAIIGGYTYNGSIHPELKGAYIYGDLVGGKVWALRYDGTKTVSNKLLVETSEVGVRGFGIVSFGLDKNSEIYILSFDGNIYTLGRKEVEVEKEVN